MKRPYRWLLIVCSVVVVGIPAVFLLSPFGRMLIGLGFMSRNVPFDKPRLQAVVEEVKTRGIKLGDELLFRLDNPKDPKSLRPRACDEYFPRGHEAGNVWAARDSNGRLVVIIETSDHGHAGQYWYAYSEARPRKTGEGLLVVGDLEENLICTDPGAEVAKNWWAVATCYMD